MSCRGLCRTHPNYVPMKKIDYSKGMRVCISCDRAIFVDLKDYHCPCCNKSLRTRPQYYGENSKAARVNAAPSLTTFGQARLFLEH